ncbi:MAG: hypothetical protein ACTSYQ_03605 [Candidatus Odinarchaeia archaeon]
MTKGRVKLEFLNQETGNKLTLIIEGALPQTLVEPLKQFLYSSIEQPYEEESQIDEQELEQLEIDSLTKKQKIELIIIKYFRNGSFNSKDLKELYQTVYDEKINLSTISTNLSRLVEEGILTRTGPRLNRRYRLFVNVARQKLRVLYPLTDKLKF